METTLPDTGLEPNSADWHAFMAGYFGTLQIMAKNAGKAAKFRKIFNHHVSEYGRLNNESRTVVGSNININPCYGHGTNAAYKP
jgi:hypothetical protein